jgi:hypothetical protein
MKDVKPTIMKNGGYSGDPSPSASPSYPSSQRESPSRFAGYHPNAQGGLQSAPLTAPAVFGPIPPPQMTAPFDSLPMAGPGPGPDLMTMPMPLNHPGYPVTSTQFQYPEQVSTYRPLQSSGLQEQQQAFVDPTLQNQLQTMPAELDLWALNSVHPNAVGFNYFQAVSFEAHADFTKD